MLKVLSFALLMVHSLEGVMCDLLANRRGRQFFLNSRRRFTQPIVVDVNNWYYCKVNYHLTRGGVYLFFVCNCWIRIGVNHIEKDEMGNLRERDNWGDPDIDGRIILRWIFMKWEGVVGTGWSWLRIGTGGGHLWVRWGTFGFRKCWEFLD